jgi:hypothetical protein
MAAPVASTMMDIKLSDRSLIERLRTDKALLNRYKGLTECFFRHGCASSGSPTSPLTDGAKQFFESGIRYLPYVLAVDEGFFATVTAFDLPDGAALKLQNDLPTIGFDAKAYMAERVARAKPMEIGE